MFPRLVYLSVTIAALFCILLIPSVDAQIGASPQVVSPEIARQMRRQSADNFTAAEVREFDKLRQADQDVIRRMVAEARKDAERYASLEKYVYSLDVSINTRLLIETADAVKAIQESRRIAEESAARQAERSSATAAWILRTCVGILAALLVGFLNRYWSEKRKELEKEREKSEKEAAHLVVLRRLTEVRDESRAAIDVANHVNDKLLNIGVQMRDGLPLNPLVEQ